MEKQGKKPPQAAKEFTRKVPETKHAFTCVFHFLNTIEKGKARSKSTLCYDWRFIMLKIVS